MRSTSHRSGALVADPPPADDVPASGRSSVPSSVLLVEDDEGDALIVRRLVAAAGGIEVAVVRRLDEAREHLVAHTVQCVLLDLSLPDARGLDTVEGVRSADPDVAIVVVSGLNDEDMAVASLQRGAQDYLTKDEIDGRSLWRAIRYAVERKRSELLIRYQANHDALTGLANRLLFMERLRAAVARLARHGSHVAVLFLDLDHFKWVNDSLGHDAGDELIMEVAARLAAALRPEDVAARLGGDEFLVLVEDVRAELDAALVAERIHRMLEEPFLVRGLELRLTASVGISLSGDPGVQADALVRDADAAMYRAKALGRDRSELFDAGLRHLAQTRLQMENDLRRAVDRGEFVVHYQPVVELEEGRLVGAEALVRWCHPSGTLLPPDRFMALAEETGLIVPIGDFVLRTACEQLRVWERRAGFVPALSVNLSSVQVADPGLGRRIGGIIAAAGVDPASLCLEVTETTILGEAAASLDRLRELRGLGVRLGIDDFGTGYSSLTYLKRYPFEVLKVDRSFTAGLGVNADDAAIVEAIVGLARVLAMEVIVEGVETETQRAWLRHLGCTRAQGFLFAAPAPADQLDRWPLAE
ncbi:MAG TPA: EAL domain-containing protein [Acidimicrobiales bacterium]|nr:EAL domain-containing protein [Acidimicrobiales bacterium]